MCRLFIACQHFVVGRTSCASGAGEARFATIHASHPPSSMAQCANSRDARPTAQSIWLAFLSLGHLLQMGEKPLLAIQRLVMSIGCWVLNLFRGQNGVLFEPGPAEPDTAFGRSACPAFQYCRRAQRARAAEVVWASLLLALVGLAVASPRPRDPISNPSIRAGEQGHAFCVCVCVSE